MQKTFRYPNFSETLKVSLDIFRHCGTKNSTKTWQPYYPKNFSIPDHFWNARVLPKKFFGKVRQKISVGKTWCPSSNPIFFPMQNIPETQGSPYEISKVCETKNSRLNVVITPLLLLCINFFHTRNFLKHRKVPHEVFWHCETKVFRRKKRDTPLLCIKFFENSIFLKHWMFLHENFQHCEKNSFDKIVIHELSEKSSILNNRLNPPFCIRFFDPRDSLKHRRFPLRIFLGIVRQKISDEIVIPLSSKKFPIAKHFWSPKVPTAIFFGTVRQRTSAENRDTHPKPPPPTSIHNFFPNPNFSATLKSSSTKCFGTVRQTKIQRKIAIYSFA